MSTRALRRMQATAAASNPEGDGEEADEVGDEGSTRVVANKFDILLPDDEGEASGTTSENEANGEEGEVGANNAEATALKVGKRNKNKKSKRGKGTKKKGLTAVRDDDDLFLEQQAAAGREAAGGAAAFGGENNDYLDDAVVRGAVESTTQRQSLCCSLGIAVKDAMALNAKCLNPAQELRYRFGTQVAGPANANPRMRGQRRILTHSRLVTPRPNWPPLGRTGLSMRQIDQSNQDSGLPTFTFEHDNTYAAAQQEFWVAVESLSPDEIGNVHRKHPFHIDTLLQLAELCLTADDPQSAADLVERAIYAMEMSFHHNFILTRSASRVLDFRYFESRSFYLALFRHVILLGRKGCTRTAFELGKLLLSLDHRRDPMCALLFLDFYALRANCNAELIAIYDELAREKSLDWLPNFAYSVPLACYRLSTVASSSSASSSRASHHPTVSSEAVLSIAKSLMFEALTKFPSVLVPLLESCSVKPDGKLASCKWFPSSFANAADEPNGLKALESLYIVRCGSVWKDMDALHWLESVISEFIESLPEEEANRRATRDRAAAAFRQSCGRNILRHLVLSGHRDPIGFVSGQLPFQAAIFSYDPLPPNNAIWSYSRQNPRRGNNTDPSSPLDLFASFFTSLLPNYNPNEQNQMQLRFDNFLQAFRDVVAGLHLEPPPFEANAQPVNNEQHDLADLTDSSDGENPGRDHDELD